MKSIGHFKPLSKALKMQIHQVKYGLSRSVLVGGGISKK